MLNKIFRLSYRHSNVLTNMAAVTRKLDKTRPEIANVLQKDVVWLCNIFAKKGYELRVVGGAVRDLLLGREAKDIDLSTTATPNEMIDVFKENNIRYIETGLQHGTLTAHLESRDYEVTTLRIDVETDGRHAKVEFTNDWRLDAERRDLTFNALSMDVDATLYDYFNGENDLQQSKVCFVGNAESRIREDYLRILRYFRFYGRIASDIHHHEQHTLDIIKKLAPGMTYLAVERVWLEVHQILVGNFAPHLLMMMYKLDVAKYIDLPIVDNENFEIFEKIWSNTRTVKISPITLLVTLLKNVEAVENFSNKWKISNSERNLACFIVSTRNEEVLRTNSLKPYKDLIVINHNSKNEHIIREHVRQLLFYHGKLAESEELDKWPVPKFPVTGGDLKKLGIKPGPDFGRLLKRLKEKWMELNYIISKNSLLEEAQKIISTGVK